MKYTERDVRVGTIWIDRNFPGYGPLVVNRIREDKEVGNVVEFARFSENEKGEYIQKVKNDVSMDHFLDWYMLDEISLISSLEKAVNNMKKEL